MNKLSKQIKRTNQTTLIPSDRSNYATFCNVSVSLPHQDNVTCTTWSKRSIIFTRHTAGNAYNNEWSPSLIRRSVQLTQVAYTISYLSTYNTTSDENFTGLSLSTCSTSSSYNKSLHSKWQ